MPRDNRKKVTPNMVVHQIQITSVDRTIKDIQRFRNALIVGEQTFHPNRVRLYDLYFDCLLDGHLTGIINKRIDAVLNKEICFYKDDKEVDGMEEFLESEVFRDIVAEIMWSKFWGLSAMEFVPGQEVSFLNIPRKHVKLEDRIISIGQSDTDGIKFDDLGSNIWIIGKDRDFGLLLQCSPYVIFKKGNYGDWAQYIEIFGQPIRIAKYDANDIKTKSQLKDALDNAGSSLSLMIPKQAEIEIMDGKTSNANGELQQRFKDSLNDELSILILGNTETTGNSNGGSNAKAKEHAKQQLEVTKSDMAFVLSKLNSKKFFDILRSYNLPVEGGKFKFEHELDINMLSQKIIIDQAVSKIVPVDDDYFYNTYHVPKPADYEVKRRLMDEKNAPMPPNPAPGGPKNNEPGNPQPKPGNPPNPAKKPQMSWFYKWRLGMADFFAPAHKDS